MAKSPHCAETTYSVGTVAGIWDLDYSVSLKKCVT